MSHSQRIAGSILIAVAVLSPCVLGCSDDNRGPTVGAPTGPTPVVISEGGGTPGASGSAGAGTGVANNAAGSDVGGAFNQAGAFGANGIAGSGDPFGTGSSSAGAFGVAGSGTFGSAGSGVPFSGGGSF